jgi:hypothetical protein
MNKTSFLTMVESYYGGKYSDVETKIISKFLDSIDNLESYFKLLITVYSKNWKMLPDLEKLVSVNTNHKRELYKIEAEKIWQKLIKKSSVHNVLIHDQYASYVCEGFGSWSNFCAARDGDYRELTHKDFLNRYVDARTMKVEHTPRIMAGELQSEYGAGFTGIQLLEIGADTANAIDDNPGRIRIDDTTAQTITSFIQKI